MDYFVYGTLTDPDRASAVLDEYEFGPDAVLSGLHLVDGTYPTLAPGGDVRGRILRTDEVAALDAYEGVDAGLYVRVNVPCEVGDWATGTAVVYVGDPDRLGVAEPVNWPGDGPLAARIRQYVENKGVTIRPV